MSILAQAKNKWHRMKRMERFKSQFRQLKELEGKTEARFCLDFDEVFPCFGDDTSTTSFDRHYIYHPAWAARILQKSAPSFHIDISSTLHFCSIVSAFIPVKFYDYRPADLQLSDLGSEAADLMKLPFADASVNSLSCMHTVEHVGLGRYGDPIDYDGDLRAMNELKRVVAVGGNFLFVTPTGKPRILFNAHRIYSFRQIIQAFEGLELVEFALVPDNPADGGLVYNATEEMADQQNYGCGCYWFTRKK